MKNKKEQLEFPKQLQREDLFHCPIWYGDEPGFVNELNKASDPYIETSKKNTLSISADYLIFNERIYGKTKVYFLMKNV